MKLMNSLFRLLAGLGVAFVSVPVAHATTIFYSFTVTATSGPLNGASATGTFSYDSSSTTPGTNNNATGLLTTLSLTWDGITYNQATANTGSLSFNPGGTLVGAVFGNNCGAGTCAATPGTEQWFVQTAGNTFTYAVPGQGVNFSGTSSMALAGVPEPSPVALLGVGIGTLLIAKRRR